MEENKTPINITEHYLNNEVKYKDLPAKLKELGIGHVWTTGVKKVVVIKKAIEALAEVERLKAKKPNATEEELKKDLDLINEKRENEIQKKKILEEKKEKALDRKEVRELVKKEFSKEVLEKNLANIEVNLINATSLQREILLKKQKNLQDLLDKA
jgi:hypothetical protein